MHAVVVVSVSLGTVYVDVVVDPVVYRVSRYGEGWSGGIGLVSTLEISGWAKGSD